MCSENLAASKYGHSNIIVLTKARSSRHVVSIFRSSSATVHVEYRIDCRVFPLH